MDMFNETFCFIPWTHPQSFYPPPPGDSSEPPQAIMPSLSTVNCDAIWQHSKQQQIVDNIWFLCHNNVDMSSTIQLDKSPDESITWPKPQVGKSHPVCASCICQFLIKHFISAVPSLTEHHCAPVKVNSEEYLSAHPQDTLWQVHNQDNGMDPSDYKGDSDNSNSFWHSENILTLQMVDI